MGIIGAQSAQSAVKVRGYSTVLYEVSALLTHPNSSHVRVHRGGITSADLECYTVPGIGLVSRNLQRMSVNLSNSMVSSAELFTKSLASGPQARLYESKLAVHPVMGAADSLKRVGKAV